MAELTSVLAAWFRVDEHGELLDSSGLADIELTPELVGYAQALLRSHLDYSKFIWAPERTHWLSVVLKAERHRFSGSCAILELVPTKPPFGLTFRELEVLTLIAAGYGNDAIASHLGISRRTVDKHVENTFSKTQIWTRSGLAGMAVDRGFLKLPTPGFTTIFPLATGKVESISRLPETERPPVRHVARRPITIGMPLPMTSLGSADALEMLEGAQLAVEHINQSGGILDREIKLLPVDCDITDPSSMGQAIKSLAEQEVEAITAGYSSADPAILDLAADYKAPFLHAATMDCVVNWVREDPGKYSNIFQTCASDVNYGGGLARLISWLIKTGQWWPRNHRIAVIQPPWPGLDIGLSDLDLQLKGLGWDFKIISDYPSAGHDWKTTIVDLHNFDPSVIVLASYFVEDSIAFQQAFSSNPLKALVYKLYSPSIPIYQETLGNDANGVLWATTTGMYNDAIGKSFASQFRSRYGRNPGRSHASIAYDRVKILTGAWSRVGNARSFGRVVEDLKSTIYRGVNGSYSFEKAGQVGLAFPDDTVDPSISQAHLVFQIQKGKQKIISPKLYSDGVFQIPPWLRRPR